MAALRRLLRSEAFRYGLLLIAGLTLLGLGVRKHDLLAPSGPPRYGDSLRATVIAAPSGEPLELTPGHWYLTIVGRPDRDRALLGYLERLLDAPELRTHNLTVTAFLEGRPEEIAPVRNEVSAFPVFDLHDFSARDLRRLGIHDHEPAYFLITPDLEVAFRSTYLQPQDLRLLLEKHFRASIDRPPTLEALRVGDRFAPRDLVAVSPLPGDAAEVSLWVVFTPDCVSCAVQSHMEKALALERELRHAGIADRPAFLFGETFDGDAVGEQLAYLGSALPAFVARSPISGIEDPYLQRSLHGHEILVVATDPGGTVGFVGSVEEYQRARKIDMEVAS